MPLIRRQVSGNGGSRRGNIERLDLFAKRDIVTAQTRGDRSHSVPLNEDQLDRGTFEFVCKDSLTRRETSCIGQL